TYTQLFKMLTLLAPDAVMTNVLALFIFFIHVVFSGYVLPYDSMPYAWRWLYWSNPLSWTLRALAQNEFLSSSTLYDTLIEMNGSGSELRLGHVALNAYGISTNDDYLWASVVFLAALAVPLLGFTTYLIKTIRHRPPFSTDASSPANEGSDDYTATAEKDHQDNGSVALCVAKGGHQGLNSLAFTPVTLSFSSLYYTIQVDKDKTTRQLLKGVHGCFEPGTLTALMGSTGAGKTTLMDVLAGRKTAGTIDGELFVNGYPLDRKTFNSVSGYCEQTDTHESTSTVREAFLFSAALRLPSGTTDDQRAGFVDDILDALELTGKANAQYLTLSQGERKRVTIGVELLSNPSILFLDEPTTGLDSRAATIVLECVKRIAQSGRTIVCTIHQPSTVLFELFDKLLLLKSGGQMAFFGELGRESSKLLGYFGQFDMFEPIKPTENPATYMLQCIGAGTGGSQDGVDFAAAYKESALAAANEALVAQASQPNGNELTKTKKYEQSFGRQFALLCGRQMTTYWRTPAYNTSRVVLMVLIPLVFGSCFYNAPVVTSMDVVSQLSMIFMATSFLCMAILNTSITFVANSRGVFYREKLSVMYTPLAHSLSLALVELLYCVVLAVIYFNVIYWLCGLNAATDAWVWFLVSLMSTMAVVIHPDKDTYISCRLVVCH
ncbi:hypothetical protein As57867_007168, partial [Aphanomyces stellatus]